MQGSRTGAKAEPSVGTIGGGHLRQGRAVPSHPLNPRSDRVDHLSLPSLRLRIEVLRVVEDSNAMLRAFDLKQLDVAVDSLHRGARALDRNERVPRSVDEQRWHGKLADRLMWPEIEDLVEQWPAEFEARVVEQEALVG